MVEKLLGGSVYVMENLFTGKMVKRAAGHVNPCVGEEEWLLEPSDCTFESEPEDEQLPPSEQIPTEIGRGVLVLLVP